MMHSWIITREIILKRDKFRCKNCYATDNLDIHHIVSRRFGGSDESNNLITLCRKCHRMVETTNIKKQYALRYKKIKYRIKQLFFRICMRLISFKRLKCSKCGSTDTVKAGKTQANKPRQKWYCNSCHSFTTKEIKT